MHILLLFLIGLITYVLVDGIWLGLIMRTTYQTMLAPHLRYVDGIFAPLWGPGILVWILLVVGLMTFVLLPFYHESFKVYLLRAALYGLVVYGVYDLTNLAIIAQWPLLITLYDIAWGTCLNILVAAVLYYAIRY